MKRIGNLMPYIMAYDNLALAYWKARKGKTHQKEVLEYAQSLNQNLLHLANQLESGKIDIGAYHTFTIFDPKERQICAASFPERVLHHALMNVCHPFFEQYQIFDSYACRKGKGTYSALNRARQFSYQNTYFAKLDVRKYFETIDHALLKAHLAHRFKDAHLLYILYQIIDSYELSEGKGIPIGNLTSQYFANHFLASADHFAKETLRVSCYVRYMDDMVLWGNDKTHLKTQIRLFENFLEETLLCAMKPTVFNKVEKGLPFLGYVLWYDKMTLAKRSRNRFKRKVTDLQTQYRNGQISQQQYQQKILPTLAFIQKSNSFSFQKSVISKLKND